MRRKIVAGNWKMNKSRAEALNFFNEISNFTIPNGVSAMLFPPSLYISDAVSVLKNKIDIGAQNCYYPNNGAFTGEISAKMISSSGAKAVIVGHSERRQYFNETNELIAMKSTSVIENGLVLVFCCGELLCERENGQHFDIIKEQLIKGLFHLNKTLLSNVVIAYEPVWAIGT